MLSIPSRACLLHEQRSETLCHRQNRAVAAPTIAGNKPSHPEISLVPTATGVSERTAHITRLAAAHEARLADLLCSLNVLSRINRFGHPASDAGVRAYAKRAIRAAVFVAGAQVKDTLIGVVEVFEASPDGTAEMAFATAAEWRRRGVALALLEVAKRWAEHSGIGTLRMVISRNNSPMRGFAHKVGARLSFDLDELYADLATDTIMSLDRVA